MKNNLLIKDKNITFSFKFSLNIEQNKTIENCKLKAKIQYIVFAIFEAQIIATID